jgi:microcystin degradation protein MlrC
MSVDKETLKAMLNNLINDDHTAAELDLHGYLTQKMQAVAGIAPKSEIDPDVNEE